MQPDKQAASSRRMNEPSPGIAHSPEGRPQPSAPTASEAARYGVLRRLGPALKHDMVVNLQAVAMMSEVLGAKLERGLPSQTELQNSVARIHRMAREAVANCLKVVGWIEPAEDEGISLREGVEESLALVRSNFNFRGFTLATELPANDLEVSRVLLRHLLLASLIHLTDRASGPGALLVSGEISGGSVLLTVSFESDPEGEATPFEAGYRQLEWADVEALAAAESIQLQQEKDRVRIRLPRMVATTPLQIAPL
ncbi:hypothetical protein JI739_11150 [Ramlibacter sp. AW1]|uniref:Uncharacterized protein n=1 Tax=Ramlibacter aurantiacus TaxID=2801330 RepID=A0A936ZP57_9BURK|nr:hypothetical protein [Ramlibacter aurantiacus]MBL0420903.1 hypothetical protein [Ramlibacter aurantiacus]